MKKILLAALLLLGCATTSFAERISTLHVDTVIEQSGELLITETIAYDFETATKHGIFRDIPFMVKNNGVKRDIGLYDFSVLFDGTPAEWSQSKQNSSHAGKIIRLKIGDAQKYITGKHTYTISYHVKLGVLPASDNRSRDAVRWNVVGTGWQVPVDHAQADFLLPPSLSQEQLRLSTYAGKYASTGSTASSQWIDPRHLQVHTKNLQPHEGLTVELAFASGTLDQSGRENTKVTFWQQIMKRLKQTSLS